MFETIEGKILSEINESGFPNTTCIRIKQDIVYICLKKDSGYELDYFNALKNYVEKKEGNIVISSDDGYFCAKWDIFNRMNWYVKDDSLKTHRKTYATFGNDLKKDKSSAGGFGQGLK